MHKAQDLFIEFQRVANHIHGVYYDATRGFGLLLQNTIAVQKRVLRKRPELTPEQLDAAQYAVGTGHPDDPVTWLLHGTNQGALKARNAKNGTNWQFIANMCVVALYQYWEDYYRKEIAKACRLSPSRIRSDIMGDLRHLRHSIIHNKGIAVSEMHRCKQLKWFRPGEAIFITPRMYEDLVKQLRSMSYEMVFRQ